MDLKKLRVNGKRLQSTLEQMAKIGGTPGGGVQRLALSDEDQQARDLFVKWLKEIDCEITIDAMGNIFGRRPGRNNALAPVMSGSHIDSQPKGGRFDGILGVMGALEVMRTLHENKVQTERPMVIVDWTNEEGSRFAPAMVGSGVWAGALKLDWVYDRQDINGKRLEDELARIGYKGTAPCRKFPVHGYYEFHIEQGPMLERQKKLIGAPKGILCLHWYDIYLTGEANQVGPTPMEGRHDALVAAAEMILKVKSCRPGWEATWWPPWGRSKTIPTPAISSRTGCTLPWTSAPGMTPWHNAHGICCARISRISPPSTAARSKSRRPGV